MLTLGCCMTGHIQAFTSKADGTVTQEYEFNNIILNQGLKNLFNYAAGGGTAEMDRYFSHLYLGTGTTIPTIYDLELENVAPGIPGLLRDGDGVSGKYDWATYEFWAEARQSFAYGEGVAAGSWTELGLGSSGGTMFSRALFKDVNGNPTTLTVATDEFLTVIYTIRYQDGMGIPVWKTATIGDQTIEYRLRPINSNVWTFSGSSDNRYSFFGDYIFPFHFHDARIDVPTSDYDIDHEIDNRVQNFDTVENKFTATLTFDPEPDGYTILYIPVTRSSGTLSKYHAYRVDFNPGIVKLPENRVTLNVDIQLEFFDPPIENFSVVLAGSTTLELSWDTLANATNYIIELRDSNGDLVETKTVPAPGLTVTFETLTPATAYTAIIHAETSGRDTGRTHLTVSTVG